MKSILFHAFNGNLEITTREEVGLVGRVNWERVEIESEVVSSYEHFDGVGRCTYDDTKYTVEQVLEEIERIDEVLWG